MNDIRKNIRRVFWLYFALFALVIVCLGKFILIDSGSVTVNAYNPRLKRTDKSIIRGSIYDTNNNLLASSSEPGTALRSYPYGDKFAHTVGYTALGRSAIEAKYNFKLQKPGLEVLQRLKGIVLGEKIYGSGIKTTLDSELQSLIYESLGNQNGAVVVMEPSTGRILSMVSYPSFNPERVEEDWALLSADENSILINRAAQGLYPPGSVFKIMTAAAAMEHTDLDTGFLYTCTGKTEIGGEQIRCFNTTAHGTIDMNKAMALSCNTYFAALGIEIGGEYLRMACDKVYFNAAYPFPLEYNKSSFVLDGDSENFELVQTSFGQGKTLVSPLHMALITSAVANGGIMMEPYLLESLVNHKGTESSRTMPSRLGQVFNFDTAESIKNMMVAAVNTGTAQPVGIQGIQVAAKTGTAENSNGEDHGWFIAFAPADNPKVAIAVLLENSGGPKAAQGIAKSVIQYVCGE